MPVANIVVAYVNQPKPGAKKGSIKTESGEMFGVWPEKLGLFSQGGKYTIEFGVDSVNGKDYKTVKRVIEGAGVNQTAANLGRGGGTTAAEMFVMGLMNRAYQNTGAPPLEDTAYEQILGLRSAWERAWATDLKPKVEKPLSQELNDDIPF